MKILFSKNDIIAAIESNINDNNFKFYKTPLVKEVAQYPYSNLVFINSAYDDSRSNEVVSNVKRNQSLVNSKKNGLIQEILNPNYSVGMIEFIVKEFKNNPLVTFLKFISFIKI